MSSLKWGSLLSRELVSLSLCSSTVPCWWCICTLPLKRINKTLKKKKKNQAQKGFKPENARIRFRLAREQEWRQGTQIERLPPRSYRSINSSLQPSVSSASVLTTFPHHHLLSAAPTMLRLFTFVPLAPIQQMPLRGQC